MRKRQSIRSRGIKGREGGGGGWGRKDGGSGGGGTVTSRKLQQGQPALLLKTNRKPALVCLWGPRRLCPRSCRAMAWRGL